MRNQGAASRPLTAQGLAEIGVQENEIGFRHACFSVSKAQDGKPRNIPKVPDIRCGDAITKFEGGHAD